MSHRIVKCQSCEAEIVFLTTAKGKLIPCNLVQIRDEDTHFDHSRHQSHFATCPNSAQHRRPR